MHRSIVAVTLLMGLGAHAHAAPRRAASVTLCRGSEKPLFACPFGVKQVAVCGGEGGAIYRFGRPGHVDLHATGLGYAEKAYSGGGETQISFAQGGYRYIVFDRTVRTGFAADGHNDTQFSAGLVLKHGDTTISTMLCTTDASIAATATALPATAFIPH